MNRQPQKSITGARAVAAWILRPPVRRAVAALVAAAATVFFIYPLFRKTDLYPVKYLPAWFYFFKQQNLPALVLNYLLPVFDAALAFFWLAWGGSALFARARRWFLGGRSKRIKKPWPRRFALAWKTALVLLSLPPAALFAVAFFHEASGGFSRAYTNACSECHLARRPLAFVRSRPAWAATVERMRAKNPAGLTEKQARAALEYLEHTRSWTGRELFLIKCRYCHDPPRAGTPRSADDWRRVLDRLSRFNSFFLTEIQADEVLDYLRNSPLTSSESPEADESRVFFEQTCVACHSLDVVLDPELPEGEWGDLLARMAQKAPGVLDPEKAAGLEDWIRAMRGDPERFGHLVPHNSRSIFFGKGNP